MFLEYMVEQGEMQVFINPNTKLYAGDDQRNHGIITSSSSIESSSSSLDIATEDDASSSNESLYNLSDLITQLPFKRRGLSKFYHGRSQSFACLSRAKSVEDLEKKESSYVTHLRKNMMKKCSKTFHGGFTNYKSLTHHNLHHPKPVISKNTNHFRRNIHFPVQENVMQVATVDHLSLQNTSK